MKKNFTKNSLLILMLALCSLKYAQAQTTYIDTVGGRYWEEIFAAVTKTADVNYGSNVTVGGSTQVLKMDVYEPTGDTVQYRPLLVIAHGGSFIAGTKADQDVVSLCNHFAKMGYVCASIEYRLGMGFPIDSIRAGKAVLRAVQDMKAAIRYFRQDVAAGSNTYRIHPDFIFAGGSSAGAFTSLHLAYMDSAEVPAYIGLNSMGGIEGASGNPGYPSNVRGVINLCGALGDSTWLNAGSVPFVSLHGTDDGTVPYATATISVLTIPVLTVDGSSSLKLRADNVGVANPFYTWYNADHVPYAGTGATALAYMDTTLNFVKAFLRPFFGIPLGMGVQNLSSDMVSIFPNPASSQINFKFNDGNVFHEIIICDVAGKQVSHFKTSFSNYSTDVSFLAKGIYIVKIISGRSLLSQKIVVQ